MLLALLLLISILTFFSIKVYVSFDNKSLKLTVKYLWLQLFKLDTSEKKEDKPEEEPEPSAEKPKSEPAEEKPEIEISEIPEVTEESKPEPEPEPEPKEEPKPEEPPENKGEPADGESGEEKKGSSLLDKWNAVKVYLPKVKTALKKLLKLIKIRDLDIHLTVGNDDAAVAGQNFGKINAVFYNALALICCLFSVTIKKTELKCDYEHKTIEANGSLLIKARILSILALAVYILINYLKVKSALDSLDKPEPESNSKKEGLT